MPVIASDLKYRLSGGAANTSPAASLGGKVSNTEVELSPILNNIFDDVTADQSLAGKTEYRCIYVMNEHATDGLSAGKIWIVPVIQAVNTIDYIAEYIRNLNKLSFIIQSKRACYKNLLC